MMRWHQRAAPHHIFLPERSHGAVYDEVAAQGCPAPYFLTWTIPWRCLWWGGSTGLPCTIFSHLDNPMALFMMRRQHRTAALHHIFLPGLSHGAVYDEVAAQGCPAPYLTWTIPWRCLWWGGSTGLPHTIFSYLNDPMALFMMRRQHRAALHHIFSPGQSHDAVYDQVAAQGCPAPYFLTWTIPWRCLWPGGSTGLPFIIFPYLDDPMTLFMMRWQHRTAPPLQMPCWEHWRAAALRVGRLEQRAAQVGRGVGRAHHVGRRIGETHHIGGRVVRAAPAVGVGRGMDVDGKVGVRVTERPWQKQQQLEGQHECRLPHTGRVTRRHPNSGKRNPGVKAGSFKETVSGEFCVWYYQSPIVGSSFSCHSISFRQNGSKISKKKSLLFFPSI